MLLATVATLTHTSIVSAEIRQDEDILAGTRVIAIETVTIRGAEIEKGTILTVTKTARDRGRLASVDLELADGYVLNRVPIATIRTYFDIVRQET